MAAPLLAAAAAAGVMALLLLPPPLLRSSSWVWKIAGDRCRNTLTCPAGRQGAGIQPASQQPISQCKADLKTGARKQQQRQQQRAHAAGRQRLKSHLRHLPKV
jgi:hypothetical protein